MRERSCAADAQGYIIDSGDLIFMWIRKGTAERIPNEWLQAFPHHPPQPELNKHLQQDEEGWGKQRDEFMPPVLRVPGAQPGASQLFLGCPSELFNREGQIAGMMLSSTDDLKEIPTFISSNFFFFLLSSTVLVQVEDKLSTKKNFKCTFMNPAKAAVISACP